MALGVSPPMSVQLCEDLASGAAISFLAHSQQLKKNQKRSGVCKKNIKEDQKIFQFLKPRSKKGGKKEEERGKTSVPARLLPSPGAFYKNVCDREALLLFGDGLRLSDEPLKRFLAALFLQFLPDHVPACQMVVVEPVALFVCERIHIYHFGLYRNQS